MPPTSATARTSRRLKLGVSGGGIEAATMLEAHLDRHPGDLLAHR